MTIEKLNLPAKQNAVQEKINEIIEDTQLEDLDNVSISNPSQGQNLSYDATNKVWKNTTVSATMPWGGLTGDMADQSDLQQALDGKINTSAKGAANGVASLDANKKIPSAQIPDLSSTYSTVANTVNNVVAGATADKINVTKNGSTSTITINNVAAATKATQDSDGNAINTTYAKKASLADVATSGSYTDLSDKPTIPTVNNATLTIQKNGTTVKTFTANASSNVTANITVPTNTNELTNGAGFITSSALSPYAKSDDLAAVATSGSYNDLSNKPTIPTITDTYSATSSNGMSGKAVASAISNKADKATSLSGYGITDAYTKTEIDGMVSAGMHYKGTKASASALPTTGNVIGDLWNVTDTGANYAWNGEAWDKLSENIDLSGYVPTSRTINSKALTGNITLSASDVGALPSNTPLPSKTSDLTNDSGFITGVAWGDVTGKPSTFTPSAHNQASNTINAMTGYSKPSSTGAIGTSDTLNTAIGKLEKALDGKQASGNYISYINNTATVAGTSKTVSKTSPETLYVPNGLVMGGSAAAAGLVTRGVCGVNSPDTTGACTKDNLYLNYDGANTYSASRQVVIQAGEVGTHYGNNLYQYAAARGDAVKGYADATYAPKSHTHDYVPTARTINTKALTANITLTASDVGALPDSTSIPSKTSDLTNDSGFITGESDTLGTVLNRGNSATKDINLNNKDWFNAGTQLAAYSYSTSQTPNTQYWWYKITPPASDKADRYWICLESDVNYPDRRGIFVLDISRYIAGSTDTVSVSLNCLCMTANTSTHLINCAIDASGNIYIQTNVVWGSYLRFIRYGTASDTKSYTQVGKAAFGTVDGFTSLKMIQDTGCIRIVNGALSGTYYTSVASNNFIGNLTGNATSASKVDAGTISGTATADLVKVKMATNDFFRLRAAGTGANSGWVELATADDGTEPIYVRQYTGEFSTIARTATLLDGSGNTTFPGTVTASSFSGNATSATTASKLGTADVGSATQGIYLDDGVAKACTYTVAKSVPADALFTDTVYTHPTTSGNKHIPSGGSSNQVLVYSSDGTAAWGSVPSHTHDYVPTARTINSKALTSNITLNYSDVGAAASSHTHTSSDITNLSSTISTAISGKADKATSLSGYGIADAYTKTEIDGKLSGAMHFKGTKASVSNLPTTGNVQGDMWNVTDTGANYAWDGTQWDKLSENIDLSGYVPTSRTVNGKALSGNISLTASDVGAAPSGHTHSVFVKSGTGAAAGFVPAPSTTAGTTKYLREDGTWVVPPGTYTHPTSSGNKHIPSGGSSGQILKWSADGTATWAAEYSYTHPTTSGNKHIPSGGSSGQFLKWSADGTATWAADNNTLNTAGSTDTSSKIFLVGATSQAANPQTYSHDTVFVDTDGALNSATPAAGNNSTKVATTAFVTTAVGNYLPKSGGTMTGAITFANNTWNSMGDDASIGDQNVGGHICIKPNTSTYDNSGGIQFKNSSGTNLVQLNASSNALTSSGSLGINNNAAKMQYNSTTEAIEFVFA